MRLKYHIHDQEGERAMNKGTQEVLKQTLNTMIKDATKIIEELETNYPKAFDFKNPVDLQARDILVITLLSEAMNDFVQKYENVLIEKNTKVRSIIHQ
jgi:hypothetical protein